MTNMFSDDSANELNAIREKYKNDPEEAWKALAASQKHIQTLETERQTDREALTKAKTIEELYEEMRKAQGITPPPVTAPTSQTPTSVLDEKTLETKVDEIWTRKTQQQREAEARQLVDQTMLNTYGTPEKSREVIKAKADELGMSLADMERIAVTAPKAFFNFFGLNNQRQTVNVAPSGSTINTAARQSSTPSDDPLDEYRQALKEDRRKAMSPEVQMAVLAKAMAAAGIKQ